MHKLFFLVAVLFFFLCTEARADFVTIVNCDNIPAAQRSTNGTFCLQTTTAGGRTAGTTWVWNGTAWIASGGTGTGGGHVIEDEGTPLSQRSNLNVTGSGAAATDAGGKTVLTIPGITVQDEGVSLSPYADIFNCTGSGIVCTSAGGKIVFNVAGGTVSLSDPYVWTGTHSWRDGNFSILNTADLTKILKFDLSGFTTGTTRTWSGPNATTRLIGDSDFSATGLMARIGANSYAARQITGTSGNIVITPDGGGLGGDININLGLTAVQTDQSNTWTTGDQNMASALSWTMPTQTGATPITSGRCAYDSTATPPLNIKCGFNGTTLTLATTTFAQPVNANLTAFAGLTGINGKIPYFTGPGTMALTNGLETPCADTGGQHLNLSSIGTFVCGTSSTGGLSGLTTGAFTKALSATTIGTSTIMSESAGNIIIAGGLTINCTTDCIDFNTLAYVGHTPYSIIFPYVGASASVAMTTGTLTTGHSLVVGAAGQIIDSGGTAGVGTWTDSSLSTGTFKTLVDEAASTATTGNSIIIGIAPYWDAESLTLPSGSTCSQAAVAAINSGPSGNFVNCTDASTSTFEGRLTLRQAVATVTFTLTVNDLDSASQHFAGDFSAMCRDTGTTVNATWGTGQSVDITMTTASNNYTGTTATLTPNGTCSSGSTLFWKFTVNTTPFTDGGNARVIGYSCVK